MRNKFIESFGKEDDFFPALFHQCWRCITQSCSIFNSFTLTGRHQIRDERYKLYAQKFLAKTHEMGYAKNFQSKPITLFASFWRLLFFIKCCSIDFWWTWTTDSYWFMGKFSQTYRIFSLFCFRVTLLQIWEKKSSVKIEVSEKERRKKMQNESQIW